MTAAVLCAFALSAAGAGEPYEWPLDLPRLITSSFAEYRAGRFHAGIDLRTGGIGVPVKAPANGHVSRIRCSPYGYGKAVYVELEDGNTAVYAHLDQFNEPLTQYLRREQHRRQSYRVDLQPSPGALPIRRGEVIAYSGRTGIGPPHLHYELRDSAQRPFNPRRIGLDWPDDTRPIITSVLVMPQGPGSRVQDDLRPLILSPKKQGPGRYVCEPVRVSGPIGFGVDVHDPANNGANILGIHRLETAIGGETAFFIQHDQLSYATLRTAAVAYHPYLLKQGRFLLQWRWPGNETLSYSRASGTGWLGPEPGSHVAAITATDFHGNAATVEVPLVAGPARTPAPPETGGRGQGKVEAACYGDWLLITAAFDHPEPEPPQLQVNGEPLDGFFRVSPAVFRAGYRPADGVRTAVLRAEHPRMPAWVRTFHIFRAGEAARTVEFGDARVTVPSEAPFGALFLSAGSGEPDTNGNVSPATALPFAARQDIRGPVYRFWPEDAPLRRPITIRVPAPASAGNLSRVHAYRAGGGRWRWLDTERLGGDLVMETSSLGVFSIQEDAMPPLLRDVEPREGAVITSRRPAIRGRIIEEGSTLAGITATLDDQWLLIAYDPEKSSFAWEQDEDLPPGPHTLRITATDEAGNTGALTRAFEIAP